MKIEKVYRKDLKKYRWKIDITVNGQRVRRADFVTKQEAIDAISALHTKARADRYGLVIPKPKITLGQLDQTSRIFKEFVETVGPDVSLVSLSRADWKKYVDLLRDRDCKPGTINRYMADVSSVLNSASERFPDLSEWRCPKAPWLSCSLGRDRLLSREEVAKLLAALRAERQRHEQYLSVKNKAEVFDLFRLMLLTGAREGEILNLRSSQISWDWRTVQIKSEKGGGSVRIIPLSDSALEILRSRQSERFFSINRDQLYRVLRRIADLSGVVYGDNIQNGWVLYDLRHVAATVMENAGVPYSAVSAILGHKRTDQTATYAHAQLDTLKRAVETLENYCREIDGFDLTSGQKTPLQTTTSKSAVM